MASLKIRPFSKFQAVRTENKKREENRPLKSMTKVLILFNTPYCFFCYCLEWLAQVQNAFFTGKAARETKSSANACYTGPGEEGGERKEEIRKFRENCYFLPESEKYFSEQFSQKDLR